MKYAYDILRTTEIQWKSVWIIFILCHFTPIHFQLEKKILQRTNPFEWANAEHILFVSLKYNKKLLSQSSINGNLRWLSLLWSLSLSVENSYSWPKLLTVSCLWPFSNILASIYEIFYIFMVMNVRTEIIFSIFYGMMRTTSRYQYDSWK